jgi:flagellar hook-length control protein FliK
MSELVLPVQPAPAKAPGAAAPPKDGDGPPDAFAEALGAAQTAESPPAKTAPARTAHAEGTKAEGDSSGRKRKATQAAPAPAPAALIGDAPAQTPAPVAPVAPAPVRAHKGGDGHGHRLGGRSGLVGAPIAAPAASGKAQGAKIVHPATATPATPLGGTADAAATTADQARPAAAASAEGAAPAPTARASNALAAAAGGAAAQGGVKPAAPKRAAAQRPVKAAEAAAKAAAPAKAAASRSSRGPARAEARPVASKADPATSQTAAGGRSEDTTATTRSDPTTSSATAQPRVRVHELAESMHALVRVANRRGTAAARITLRPAELGGVQVRLRAHEGGVSAQITAETSAGAQALGASHAELRRSLESQGIVVHTIDVQLAGDGLGADGSARQWESQNASAQAAAYAEDDVEGETTIEPSLLPDSGAQVDVLA